MNPQWKNRLVAALKFSIPAAIIGFLLWRIEPQQWDGLSQQPKNYALLVGCARLVALGAMSLSFSRWCLLVRCQGIELSMLEAFRLGSIGFLLSFVSAGSVGGDLFKAIFLAQRRPGKRIEAVASVFVDRGVGLYGLLLLVAITLLVADSSGLETASTQLNGLPSSPTSAVEVGPTSVAEERMSLAGVIDMQRIKWLTAILVGTGTTVLAILVLGGKRVDRLIQWAGEFPLFGPLVLKIGGPLRMFHTHPVAFVASVVMSLGVHLMLVISFYFVARGLYGAPPTMSEHFIIVPMGMLASALPVTPAGVGVLEAAVEALYHVVPAVKTDASGTLVALVFEMVKVTLAMIGTVFYWTASAEVRHSIEMAEEETHATPAAV